MLLSKSANIYYSPTVKFWFESSSCGLVCSLLCSAKFRKWNAWLEIKPDMSELQFLHEKNNELALSEKLLLLF